MAAPRLPEVAREHLEELREAFHGNSWWTDERLQANFFLTRHHYIVTLIVLALRRVSLECGIMNVNLLGSWVLRRPTLHATVVKLVLLMEQDALATLRTQDVTELALVLVLHVTDLDGRLLRGCRMSRHAPERRGTFSLGLQSIDAFNMFVSPPPSTPLEFGLTQ